MSNLFTFSLAGVAFITLSLIETLTPILSPTSLPFIRFTSTFILSTLSILSSLISFLTSHDPLGPLFSLSTLSISALFFLYAAAGLAAPLLALAPPILDLLLLAAFSQQLLLLSLHRTDGIETRYLDLLRIPVLLCALATLAAISRPGRLAPRLARAAGLFLHGTWLIQMGFSFFSTAMANGCSLQRRSRGNYTIKCRDHPEYHRGRAIATLQFNCHLALLAVVSMAMFAAVVSRGLGRDARYRPLGKEMHTMDVSSQFTLDSDDEEDEIKVEANGSKQQHVVLLPVSETNGFSGHH